MFSRLASAFLIVLCLFAVSLPASAHTWVERSWPRAEETVAAPPPALRLLFTERVEPALTHVTLTGAEGQAIALGAAALDAHNRRVLVVPITGALRPGGYEVAWRVVSADGHPMEGRFHFSVGP